MPATVASDRDSRIARPRLPDTVIKGSPVMVAENLPACYAVGLRSQVDLWIG